MAHVALSLLEAPGQYGTVNSTVKANFDPLAHTYTTLNLQPDNLFALIRKNNTHIHCKPQGTNKSKA